MVCREPASQGGVVWRWRLWSKKRTGQSRARIRASRGCLGRLCYTPTPPLKKQLCNTGVTLYSVRYFRGKHPTEGADVPSSQYCLADTTGHTKIPRPSLQPTSRSTYSALAVDEHAMLRTFLLATISAGAAESCVAEWKDCRSGSCCSPFICEYKSQWWSACKAAALPPPPPLPPGADPCVPLWGDCTSGGGCCQGDCFEDKPTWSQCRWACPLPNENEWIGAEPWACLAL